MTETQEAHGGRIEGGRFVAESFHKGQDLSPFGHPYWPGITNSEGREGREGLTAAHSRLILTLQRLNASASRGKRVLTSLFQPPPQGTGTANWDPQLGTGPIGRTSTPLRTIDNTATHSTLTLRQMILVAVLDPYPALVQRYHGIHQLSDTQLRKLSSRN
jgi:hypothetical protein